ncbi:hypothetical protein CK203_099881 [Vitis vinifera]|uniref:Uncharacterized protein n=1 Tax=Vitis vinifera TaxID=29760 RepID=A0A438DAE5_VITVI|nr:hypothetical protein CK203_099881 [Vitis vinifera]
MVTQPPIEGNLDCKARPFHSELCFDIATFKLQPEVRDSFHLLQRYHMEHLLTPRDFFYPHVALDFYQSMTTKQVRDPTVIHFTIDGRHGILGARHIAEALHIPYEPARPEDFRAWTHPAQSDIVHTLSRGASSRHYILRKELPPSMFFIDALLHHNIFPLQHWVQRRGVLLEALFRISEGYFFGPYHLIMAALLLLCQILEHLGYPAKPQLELKHICREIFTLDRWTSMTTYGVDQGAPARVEHPEEPVQILVDTPPPAPAVASTEHISEVTPSAPQATPQTAPVIPPTSEPSPLAEPRIAIPIIEYRGLCHTFQALATSQSIFTPQMTALRAHQEQIIATQT